MNSTNQKQIIDYSAFATYSRQRSLKAPRITAGVTAGLLAIIAIWLLNTSGDITFGLLGLLFTTTLIGGPLLLYFYFFAPRQRGLKKFFNDFAIANQFTYIGRQKLENVRLLYMGSIVTAFTSYYRTVPTYYGVWVISLNQNYPHLVAERKPRTVRPWVKDGAQPG